MCEKNRFCFFVFVCDTYVRGYIYGTSTVQCIMNIGETSRKKSFFGKNTGKNLFVGKKAVINSDYEQVLTHCINSDSEQC